MEEINGEFIMKGCAEDDPDRLDTPEQLAALLSRVGFLPLFSNSIPGFSVEEHTVPSHWWTGEDSDPWEWRHVLSSHPDIAYGKFFGKKAGFIHKSWFPVFANYRRNGYDFDALYDDGLAPFKWKSVMDLFELDDHMIGKELPAKDVPHENIKTDLEMRTYLIIAEFYQKRNKKGQPYGWHFAKLGTPETKWGYDFVTSEYNSSPEDSWACIKSHVHTLYPSADDKEIWSLIGMRILSPEPEVPKKPQDPFSALYKAKKNPAKPTVYPDNLISDIAGISLPLSDDQRAGLDYAITTLKGNEQRIIKLRYENGGTYAAVGKELSISGTRVQQLCGRAIRKLRHPSRFVFIRDGLAFTTRTREDRIRSLSDEELDALPVNELNLSTRVTTCLTKSGYDTLGSVRAMLIESPDSLLKIRYFGPTSAKELADKLKECGIPAEVYTVATSRGEKDMIRITES